MNFYCSVVDDYLRHEHDEPTIGLILCQTKDRILAEYALRDVHKPIGVADYELTRALPSELASSLPRSRPSRPNFKASWTVSQRGRPMNAAQLLEHFDRLVEPRPIPACDDSSLILLPGGNSLSRTAPMSQRRNCSAN